MRAKTPVPTLIHEKRLWTNGYRHVAGVDEAGRGAWAGPVVAAAVILPPLDPDLPERLAGVRDSKCLTPARRQALLPVIQKCALGLAVGIVPPAEIDNLGILPATRKAMAQALADLSPPADYVLLDYVSLPNVALNQFSLPKGDVHVLSIAAASIVAKVCRDSLMTELEDHLPGYGFARHKGYGTAQHRTALAALGPSQIHRLSFAPLRQTSIATDGESKPRR